MRVIVAGGRDFVPGGSTQGMACKYPKGDGGYRSIMRRGKRS